MIRNEDEERSMNPIIRTHRVRSAKEGKRVMEGDRGEIHRVGNQIRVRNGSRRAGMKNNLAWALGQNA
jgi:hypothetical protein